MFHDLYLIWIDQITKCCPSILSIHFIIAMFCETDEEHDLNFINLMKVLQKNDPVFNSANCDIWQPLMTFYSCDLLGEVIKHDPAMAKDIAKMPTH